MSDQVKVDRHLVFQGPANYTRNVKGDMNPTRIFREWNFKELALDETNQYTKYVDGTSAVALADGGITLTTAASDTKTCSYAFGGLFIRPTKNPTVEFKFQLDVITTVAINAVLTDATAEGTGALPFTISGTTISDNVANALGFCFDTNQGTVRWYIVNCNANANAGTLLAAAQAPFVAATDVTQRIAIDTSGNVRYYYNGVSVGYKALAVATTSLLCPYIGIRNNTATAHVAKVRYVRLWEDA